MNENICSSRLAKQSKAGNSGKVVQSKGNKINDHVPSVRPPEAGLKVKATSTKRAVRDEVAMVKKTGPNSLIKCEICACEMSSDLVLTSHINGSRHKKRLKALEIVANLKAAGETGIGIGTEDSPNIYRCDLCSLTMNSPQQLEVHLSGAKHKNKTAKGKLLNLLNNLNPSDNQVEEVPCNDPRSPPVKRRKKESKSVTCDVCNILVNSEIQYKQNTIFDRRIEMDSSRDEKVKLDENIDENIDNGVVEERLMKPFNAGWKREVVMRVATGNINCDIYYFHPNGKKFRSLTEVKANLTDGLTADCFTFQKKPLNVDSEIVRKAMVRGRPSVKPTTAKELIKSKPQGMVQKRASLKKKKNLIIPRSGTRRQRLIRKIEQQRSILEIKKLKKPKCVPKSKKKRIVEKVTESKETKKYKKTYKKVKPKKRNQCSGVQLKLGVKSTQKNKLDNVRTVRKSECNDIRSIVQRNIGKYRELRKKQIKEGLRERVRNNISYKMTRLKKSSDPISNNLEVYLKPLEMGWRRELVHRVNGPDAAGRSDVYYFHPNGKKLRSTREVADNLTQGLTVDCFTFRKEPLGCGEPQEVIRNARLKKNAAPEVKK